MEPMDIDAKAIVPPYNTDVNNILEKYLDFHIKGSTNHMDDIIHHTHIIETMSSLTYGMGALTKIYKRVQKFQETYNSDVRQIVLGSEDFSSELFKKFDKQMSDLNLLRTKIQGEISSMDLKLQAIVNGSN